MRRTIYLLFAFFLYTGGLMAQGFQFSAKEIDIPHKTYTLPNGLTLIVHEDHKAPIVAVNVWYHVGSKNEKPGKSGFAHLFEHLMFNGSENYNNDYFQALERIGGTDLNGTTNTDRTNYFQNVPLAALEQVLFLESDRMGHLLGAIDQAKLDEQRGVVQNEKRQGENQPYGKEYDLITKAMYPKGHPYSWTVIGEMEDLNAASLDDVHEWFKSYYGAANAVIAIAGDINPDEIYKKVVSYFGDIPAGPTIVRPEVNIPIHPSNTKQVYQDRVPEAKVDLVWNSPEFGSQEDIYLDLVSSVLSTGKNSRLYKKFIYEDQSASSARAAQWSSEIASNYVLEITAKPGRDIYELKEQALEIIREFVNNGPTQQELDRAKATYFSGFIKGIERIGGFGGTSDILASGATYHGDSEHYKKQLMYAENATTEDLKKVAQKWLTKNYHTLVCEPFPEYSVTGSEIDRTKLPALGTQPSSKFPTLQRATLKNGLEVVLAQRPGVPTMVIDLVVDAGFASDQFASAGTAALAMNLMDEGTKNYSSLELSEQLQMLGATIGAYSDLDMSYVSMNTLKPSLDASLAVFADVILNPAFPESEFNRLKNEQLSSIQREKSQPISMTLRVMNRYLYGEGHAYANPFSGSGYEATVSQLTKKDMVAFYDRWMKPNNSTITVVGDIDIKSLTDKLEGLFGKWKKGDVPTKNIGPVTQKTKNTLYLMDRPESQQSVIISGHTSRPYGEVSEISQEAAMNVLGGQFTSRINMNLREDKHWSYGAGSFMFNAKGPRSFIVYAPVQTDKSGESVAEIIKEVTGFVSDKPVTKEELEKVVSNSVLQLPGQWETNNAVSNSLNDLVKYKLADDYYQTYDENVRNLSLKDVNATARELIRPGDINWFIVGDKAKIIEKLKEVGFENIIEIDADGNPLNPTGEINIEGK